ncbi:MAG: septum formation initiator family protein [Clostridium sp.]|nr:septum formation initiator family protein [Clostridium sp.]
MKKRLTLKNLIIVVLAIIFVVAFARQEQTMKRIEENKQAKQEELQELQNKNERLEEESKKAQTDEYLEKLARERLNMVKQGETSVEMKKVD